jgi:hypothetical protein
VVDLSANRLALHAGHFPCLSLQRKTSPPDLLSIKAETKERCALRILNNHRLQTLGLTALDVDGLDVAVQLLLGALLVVTLS